MYFIWSSIRPHFGLHTKLLFSISSKAGFNILGCLLFSLSVSNQVLVDRWVQESCCMLPFFLNIASLKPYCLLQYYLCALPHPPTPGRCCGFRCQGREVAGGVGAGPSCSGSTEVRYSLLIPSLAHRPHALFVCCMIRFGYDKIIRSRLCSSLLKFICCALTEMLVDN